MKLVVQIPCYNEAESLPNVIADIPRQIPGFSTVEILVIDDGSTDGTAQVAVDSGADAVHRMPRNRGLAAAFSVGLERALDMGADVIVNTDGDHQYRGEDIPSLVLPIVQGRADMVVGDRQVRLIPHFSLAKKILQTLGTWIVRWFSNTDVVDATSGFRAFSREAASRLFVFSTYTYTLETVIQAGKKGLIVASVPVRVNPASRESRLISSIPVYILKSAITILRIFLMYEPLRAFSYLSLAPLIVGLGLLVRYGYYFVNGLGQGHVQSVVVGSVLVLLAFQILLLGLLADLIGRNRRLGEEATYLLRSLTGLPEADIPRGIRGQPSEESEQLISKRRS